MNNELQHYGIKGMKWGVRKATYKSANRKRRKEIKKAYNQTPQGYMDRGGRIGGGIAGVTGLLLGGLPGAVLGGAIGGGGGAALAYARLSQVDKNVIKRGHEATIEMMKPYDPD